MPAFGVGSATTAAAASTANTVRAQEWWLAGLNVTQAWQQTRGAGVTVAVLGTGVAASHPDLAGDVITGPDYSGSGRTPGSPFWGIDGTQVAAIIAGHGHGPGRQSGIIGVAPAAKILSIRVDLEFNDPLNADQAITRRLPGAIADGITYAVNHGARVIDLPLDPGTFGPTGQPDQAAAGGSPAEQAAVAYALRKSVVLVAPAGDDGEGPGLVNHPAAYAGVIAVGAVGRDGRLGPFSSRRSYVALTAPGVNLTAASPPASYATVSSTSAASGIVAGVAALLLSRFPQLTAAQVTQALTKSTATTAVTDGAAGPGTGYGTPDAARAVTLAADISTATRPTPSPTVSPSPTPTKPPRPAVAIPRRANASALAGSLVRDIVAALGVLIVLVVVLLLIMSSRRRRVLAGRVPRAAGSPGPSGRSQSPRERHGRRRLDQAPRADRAPGPDRASGPDRAPGPDPASGPDRASRADRATGPVQETALGIRPPLAGPAAPAGPAAGWPAPGGWQGGGVGEIAHPPAAPGRPAMAPAPRTSPAGRSGSGAGTPAGPPWAPAPEPERTFGPLPVTSANSFTPEPGGGIRVPPDMPPPTTMTGPWPAAFDPTERPAASGFTAQPPVLDFTAVPPASASSPPPASASSPPPASAPASPASASSPPPASASSPPPASASPPPASAPASPAPAVPRPSAEPDTSEPTVTPDLGPPTIPGFPRLDTGQDPVDLDVTRPIPAAAPPSQTSLGFAAAPVAAVYPAPDLPVDYRVPDMPSDATAAAGPGGTTDSGFLWDLAATDVFPVAPPEPPEAPDDDAPGASGS